MIEEQIIRLYGERCAEHCDDCCVCEVWAMHDLIETQAREIERLREAMHMAMLELGSHGACPACLNAHSILQNALAGDSHDQ